MTLARADEVLEAQAQRELNDQADRFEDVIAEIHAEMRGVRDELARLRTLDSAIDADVERGHRWLN